MDPESDAAESAGAEIELSADAAAEIVAVNEMLQGPLSPTAAVVTLEALLEATGAPLRVEADALQGGRRVVASRDLAPGETLFSEDAVAWFLAPPAGYGAVSAMAGPDGRMVAALPAWLSLRLLRDTLTFSPPFNAESGYATVVQLTSGDRPAAAAAASPPLLLPPPVPPGILETPENAVPPRAQLLGCIAQCNAFQVPLPEEDSAWKRALLWPALGRIVDAADRDILFDDPAPFAAVSAFLPLAALLNHACDPAAKVDCEWREGDPAPRAAVRTLREVASGCEVTNGYLSAAAVAELGVEQRRRALLVTYGFECACARCTAEAPGAGVGDSDALLDAGHFPEGVGLRGRAAFFARGGVYPRDDDRGGGGAGGGEGDSGS